MTCSALRGYYRDILRGTHTFPGLQRSLDHLDLPAYFVYLKGHRALLLERISKREGHCSKAGLLDSQLHTLESPEGEKRVVVVPLDVPTEEQAEIAIRGQNNLFPELL